MANSSDEDEVDDSATSEFEGVTSDDENDLELFSHDAGLHEHSIEAREITTIYRGSIIVDNTGEEGPSFRLLRIWNGALTNEIHCDLIKRPIYKDGLQYKALSHSWGREPRSKAITVGLLSQKISITQHLHGALRRLRREDRPVYVWVDALCIDQLNLQEKTSQILLVAQIFSEAEEVIIWLGESHALSNDAIQNEDAFFHLCLRPHAWWTRLWVVQETLYATKEPVVLLGSQDLTMSDFLTRWRAVFSSPTFGASYNAHSVHLGTERSMDSYARCLHEGFQQMGELYNGWLKQSLDGSHRRLLIDRIRSNFTRHCKEPRDRVYALLTLIPEREAELFRPDYQKTPGRLFDEVVHYHLHHTNWSLPALRQLVGDLFGRVAEESTLDWTFVRSSSKLSYEHLADPERNEGPTARVPAYAAPQSS